MRRWAAFALTVSVGCGPTKPPIPPATPPPPTTTTTTTTLPRANSCPLQLPLTDYRITLRVGHHGDTPQQYDSTPEVRPVGPDRPVPPGWTGSCEVKPSGALLKCDVSPERDIQNGADCTIALCGPMPFYALQDTDGQTVVDPSIGLINWQNGYLVKVTVSKQLTLYGQCLIGGGHGTIVVP